MSGSQYYQSTVAPNFEVVLNAYTEANATGWAMLGTHMPTNEIVYAVRFDISEWLETQPIHLWKRYEVDNFTPCYIIKEELLSWMILKWK